MVQRHRHIFAAPLAFFLFGASLLARGESMLQGNILDTQSEFFGGEGIHEIVIGEYRLMSWSGFFFAQESFHSLSVAALTSPVLVRSESELILVPVGWQWRTDGDIERVPAHFLKTSLMKIKPFTFVTVPDTWIERDAWMIASVHPLMRDWVWVMAEPPDATDNDRVTRLMMFPTSDTLRDAAALFTVERWTVGVRAFLEHTSDPGTFLHTFIPHIVDTVRWFEEKGYPERAQRYQEVLEKIVREFRVFVSEESMNIVQALRSEEGTFLRKEFENFPSEASDAPSSSAVPFDADIVAQQAYVMLRDMGALFTIHTEIVPQSGTTVEVRGMVFGDHTFDFSLDIDQQVLDAIVMDGQLMAYPMGVEEFKRWITSLN